MAPLRAFAERGGPVLGICNGSWILTEGQLPPEALVRGRTLRFHCHWEDIRIEGQASARTRGIAFGEVLRLPVAHREGADKADDETLNRLEAEGRVIARCLA
ncbi:MAG: phosphoribosylformylglycinamidine synthase subunit PurQ [Chloroflexota bacterium]|nr:phosphoribosylformylglycinamidine synthase subunit PurQ [Chloroflexota bacterium]